MTDLDLTKLRTVTDAQVEAAAEVLTLDIDGSEWDEISPKARRKVMELTRAALEAAFDPPTALELIDEIERLREMLATVRSIADGTPECDKYDDKSPVTCGWKFDLQRIKEVVK